MHEARLQKSKHMTGLILMLNCNWSRLDNRFANMTITLSVRASSGTNVTCVTFVGNVKNTVNGTIFLAG